MPKHSLPIIDYTPEGVETNVAMAAGLRKAGGFILINLPKEFSEVTTILYKYGNIFFNMLESGQINSNQFKHKIKRENLNLVSHAKDGVGGCLWGNRIIATMNSVDRQESISNIPAIKITNQIEVNEAFLKHHSFMQSIFQRILKQLEIDLGLKNNSLQQSNIGRSATGLTRFVPATQKRIREVYHAKKLCVIDKEKKDIILHVPHVDISGITGICYPSINKFASNDVGLCIKDNSSWKPVKIPTPILYLAAALAQVQQLLQLYRKNNHKHLHNRPPHLRNIFITGN